MVKKFLNLPRLVQIILLIFPFVGWIVELIIRWSTVLEKFTILNLVTALVFTFFGWGIVLQIVDAIWLVLYDHLLFIKA